MKTLLMAKSTRALCLIGAWGMSSLMGSASAQNFPITPAQQATAKDVAQRGVPLSDLAADAPERYTVKSGDTLWAISSMYLKSPWRWPELWGMNMQEVANPHRIYPGQVLVLERGPGGATLRIANGDSTQSSDGTPSSDETVRISPRTRYTSLLAAPLPTLRPGDIEQFLVEPLIVDATEFEKAPKIVSGKESRIVMASGDRIYARGPKDAPLLDDQPQVKHFRIYGSATPLLDPDTGKTLAYEAKFEGTASLVKSEVRTSATDADGKTVETVTAAALEITSTSAEVNIGDRLIDAPTWHVESYTPHAPATVMQSRIISVYGTAVTNAAQNQVVAISSGKLDGVDPGTVFAILKNGAHIDSAATKHQTLKLPDERIGLLMVFRTFDHVSYGLILQIVDGVRIGDRVVSPQ